MSKNKAFRVDHKKKTITVTRKLNPPSFHVRMFRNLINEYPEYTVVERLNHADS